MITPIRAALSGLLLAALAAPAFAHHSGAMFDNTRTVVFQGTVKELNWSNPHISIDVMEEPKPGGPAPRLWTIEASSTGVMNRAGWTKRSLVPGDKVTMSVFPLRDGGPRGSIDTVMFADGRKTLTFLGRPNGAPVGGFKPTTPAP